MASPNATFTELVSTTFRKHRKEIKDNLSNRNALLKYLNKRGNTRKEDGGLTIATPLDYAENTTSQRYSDWDPLSIAASSPLRSTSGGRSQSTSWQAGENCASTRVSPASSISPRRASRTQSARSTTTFHPICIPLDRWRTRSAACNC